MKNWKIPVIWTMVGTVDVKANTLKEAVEIAQEEECLTSLPDDGEFLEDSLEVDCFDLDLIRSVYNDNQPDGLSIQEQVMAVLRQMCFGKSREWSENMICKICDTNVVQSNCVEDDVAVDEDIVISALMEIVFNNY